MCFRSMKKKLCSKSKFSWHSDGGLHAADLSGRRSGASANLFSSSSRLYSPSSFQKTMSGLIPFVFLRLRWIAGLGKFGSMPVVDGACRTVVQLQRIELRRFDNSSWVGRLEWTEYATRSALAPLRTINIRVYMRIRALYIFTSYFSNERMRERDLD